MSVRCGEAEAGDASEGWRRAIGLMTPWEPRLAAIVSCAFDTPYRPVTIRDDVPLDHRRPNRAWTVVHDPHHGPSPVLDALARVDELVALLLALDTELLSDPDDATRLREILAAVLADPAARRLLLDQLGPEGFAAVIDRLARIVVGHLEDDHVVAAAVGVLAQLSGGLAAGVRHGEAGEADYRSALLDGSDGDPHLLAMVLRHGGFPTPVVVAWAFAILGRAGSVGPGGLGSFVGAPGERTGDLLLQALTDNPFAGREVLLGLDQLDLLLGSHLDGDRRGLFLATVTDPSRFLRSDTLPILTKVLGYLGDHRDVTVSTVSSRDLHDWLGAVVGPWLLHLDLTSAAPLWAAQAPADVVAWIAERPAAALDLVQWIGEHAHRQVLLIGGSGGQATAPLIDLARTLGTAIEVVARGRLSFALHRRGVYDGAVGVLEFLSGKAVSWVLSARVPPARIVTPIIDKVTEEAVGAVLDGFEDHGWTEPPAEPGAARAAIEQEAAAITTGVVGLVVASAHARGGGASPPPPAPVPGENATSYVHRVERWSRGDADRRQVFETAADVHDAVVEGRAATGTVSPAVPAPWLETEVSDNVVEGRTATRR